MPPVKRENPTAPNPVEERLLLLTTLFSPWEERLTYAKLEALSGLTGGALKDSVKRGSISKAVAAKLLEAAPRHNVSGLTLDWLQLGRGEPPQKGGFLPPGVPAAERSSVVRENTQAGGVYDPTTSSGPVRSVDEQEQLWKGFRVLASRIARTVQHTIAGNELGYTPASRAMLASALEAFARELDDRAGETVCGDIWKVVARLRRGEGP